MNSCERGYSFGFFFDRFFAANQSILSFRARGNSFWIFQPKKVQRIVLLATNDIEYDFVLATLQLQTRTPFAKVPSRLTVTDSFILTSHRLPL
jgi:hypothetical protein